MADDPTHNHHSGSEFGFGAHDGESPDDFSIPVLVFGSKEAWMLTLSYSQAKYLAGHPDVAPEEIRQGRLPSDWPA
jgi:hypothetical protein